MGRMVSCASCGAWHEVQPTESPQGWVCLSCRSARSSGAAPGRSGPGTLSGMGPIGGAASSDLGHTSVVGADSGQIGSSSLSSAHSSLQRQLSEMRAAVDGIRIGTGDLTSIADRLAHSAEAARIQAEQHAKQWATPVEGGGPTPVADIAADTLPPVENHQRAPQIGQAASQSAASPGGIGPEVTWEDGRASQSRAVRATEQARQAAAAKQHKAAASVPLVAQPAAGSSAGLGRGAVKRAIPQTATTCLLCGDRMVLGDRVTSCPQCGEHYHADCYKLLGSCVSPQCRTKGEGAKSYRVAEPARAPAQPAGPQESTRRCTSCGAAVSPQALVCPKCGQWMSGRRRQPAASDDPARGKLPAGCIVAIVIILFVLFLSIATRH